MKVVILAGGFGTRISEESHLKPKPMIEIGGVPIIWHIMKHFSYYGHYEFIICCGYKGFLIKDYFANYYLLNSDVTFDFSNKNKTIIHNNVVEPWKVTVVDTGLNTQTGGRIKRIEKYTEGQPFFMTYGDGVSDVNLDNLLNFHSNSKKSVTITAVQPGGRFGMLDIDEDGSVLAFSEKSKESGGWINGGFMVMEQDIFNYLDGDECVLEKYPMEVMSRNGVLGSFKHNGFWQCMDTQRDKNLLERLWAQNNAPWKVYED